MTESDEAQQDIKRIKWHLENIDNKVDMLVRGNEEAIEEIAEIFRGDPTLAKVYLEIDGDKTQNDISEEVDKSPATVSRRIDTLERYGLIQKKEYDGGMIYMKDELHEILMLDQMVDPEKGWNDD